MYSLDPRNIDWVDNTTIFPWRQYLKAELLRQRSGVSDYSLTHLKGKVEMHEGIVTRAVVPKNVHWHWMIYHPYNCFLLTPQEHREHGHEREWALKRSYDLYGHENVIEWFESLPWKVRPFKLL